ncbi:ComF family protein [uncultured Bacteroides sp.]|uniref:ComF family protein n=1 Tax=uncultured Bacteroides sp. TaxID=162156 RepID=UPI00374A8503
MIHWIDSFFNILFPRSCVVCNGVLVKGEESICTMCNSRMPRTNYHLQAGNEVEQRFWGKVEIERATSYFFYTKGSDYRHILFKLKYHGYRELGEVMGRYMAKELLASGFFQEIDLIIPVPLHSKRKRSRGYNQSEWIASGLSHATGIPMDLDSLKRVVASNTQTRKSVFERWENVKDVFQVACPDNMQGKHILLVDDVLTTGATLLSCATILVDSSNVKISVITLAVA